MARGYCIEWSAWRVWLHPRSAFEALTDAQIAEDDFLRQIEEYRAQNTRLYEELEAVRRRYLAAEDTLAQTRRQLDDALDELAEHESVDQKLAEFNKMLSGVETMKRNYEKRIFALESRLRDERKKSQKDDCYELWDSIDMQAQDSDMQAKDQSIPSESRHLHVRDGFNNKSSHVILHDNQTSTKKDDKTHDSDDWLLELPPDL